MKSSRVKTLHGDSPVGLVMEFLNCALKPVSNKTVKIDDVKAFIELVKQGQQGVESVLLETIMRSNPEIIIRLFFPSVQLPQTLVNFLNETVIVIRSQCDLFNHQRFNPPTTSSNKSHEIKMSLLELFLLTNHGLYLRILDTETENNIGIWDRNLKESLTENYFLQIEIIPPKSQDLFTVLKCISQLRKFSDKFTIPAIDLTPHQLKSERFETALKSAFKALDCNVEETIENTFTQLLQPHTSAADSKDEISVEKHVDMQKATTIVERLAIPFRQMLTTNNQSITLNAITNQTKYQKDLFNYIALYFLLLLGKEQYTQVTNLARHDHHGDNESSNSNKCLQTWIYQILEAVCINQRDDLQSIAHHNLKLLTNNYLDSHIRLSTNSLSIPAKIFNIIFDEKNITMINKVNTDKLTKMTEELDSLKDQPTEVLLAKLFATQRSLHSSIYIRKIRNKTREDEPLTVDRLKNEFGDLTDLEYLLYVRPATFHVPGIPIATHRQAWLNSSGVFIITPPDDAVMAAYYKRSALSDALAGSRANLYGFPYSAEVLWAQGGKVSYTTREFYRRILSIELRAEGKLKDMSRKEFFRNYFIRITREAQPFSEILGRELTFTAEEIQAFENNTTITSKPDSDYKHYIDLEKNIQLILKLLPLEVIMHYLKRLKQLVGDALRQKKSILAILNIRENKSLTQRYLKLKNNKYTPEMTRLPDQLLKEIAIRGNRYFRHQDSAKYHLGNEVLLQGLRPYDQAHGNIYPIMDDNWNASIMIKYHLINRHGNYPAVYVNMSKKGIEDAWRIHEYLKSKYGSSLPFFIYDENSFEFKIISAETLQLERIRNGDLSIIPAPALVPAPALTLAAAPALARPQLTNQHYIDMAAKRRALRPPTQPKPKKTKECNFKTSKEWKVNYHNMLEQLQDYSDYFKKAFAILGTDFLPTYNGNFTCKFNLYLTMQRQNTALVFTSTLPFEFKCINDTYAFKYSKKTQYDPQTRLREMFGLLNQQNFNPANETLTSSSFVLTTSVSDAAVTDRNTEKHFYGVSKRKFVIYGNNNNYYLKFKSLTELTRRSKTTPLRSYDEIMSHTSIAMTVSSSSSTNFSSSSHALFMPPATRSSSSTSSSLSSSSESSSSSYHPESASSSSDSSSSSYHPEPKRARRN
jgi:hypothetical protein